MYYGQHKEDQFLNETFFKNKKNGFFIELGALDGVTFSNTLFFEKHLNWSGILIEPHGTAFEMAVKNRPNSVCYNYAIADFQGEAVLENLSMHPAMNRIQGRLEHEHQIKGREIVKTIPIKDILKNHKISKIDLFSIDVEGSEKEVLTTMDWNIEVDIILIEIKNNQPPVKFKNEECRHILKKQGFVYHSSTLTDEVWINPKRRIEV